MKRAGAPWSLVTVFALGLAACGYQPVHGAFRDDARLHVVLASTQVADPIAADEVVAGVREALARRATAIHAVKSRSSARTRRAKGSPRSPTRTVASSPRAAPPASASSPARG